MPHNMSKKQIIDMVDYMQTLGIQNESSEVEKKDGCKLLFNGKILSGWHNFRRKAVNSKWIVQNGKMHLTARGGRYIVTDKQFTDFELKLEWKISEAGNSGTFIRTTENHPKPWMTAVEMQVLGNEKHGNGKVSKTRAASLYALIAAPNESSKKAG